MGKRIIPQHEPLRVPQGWTEQARAFVIQLERIIDRIYAYVSGGFSKQEEELESVRDGITGLGTVVLGTNTYGIVSVPDAEAKKVSEITLPAGAWVVVAAVDWVANANGSRQLAITSDGVNPARNRAVTTPAIQDTNKETYQQVIYIHKRDEEITLGVYARQTSGSALSCYPYSYAIKIGS